MRSRSIEMVSGLSRLRKCAAWCANSVDLGEFEPFSRDVTLAFKPSTRTSYKLKTFQSKRVHQT